jgi:hypothetical protein
LVVTIEDELQHYRTSPNQNLAMKSQDARSARFQNRDATPIPFATNFHKATESGDLHPGRVEPPGRGAAALVKPLFGRLAARTHPIILTILCQTNHSDIA